MHGGDGRVAASSATRSGRPVGRADQPVLGRVAGRRAPRRARAPHRRVAGHDPVRRVLAAADPHDPVRLDRDAVLARRLDRRAARRGDEWPQPGVGADDSLAARSTSSVSLTVASSWSISQPSAVGSIGGAVVRRVGRADEPVVRPRDQEHDLARHPDRQPGRLGIRSRGTTRWAPRLGRMRIDAPRTGGPPRPPRRPSRR